MFKCPDCDKVYKTKTSLTRHAHNHGNSPASHACDTCGVVFARRDILNRHVSNGHCSASAAGRHRTHTACEPCRAARIKCDGRVPCRACAGTHKDCKYPTKTGRISHATRLPRPPRASPLNSSDSGIGKDMSSSPSSSMSADEAAPTNDLRHDSARSDSSGPVYKNDLRTDSLRLDTQVSPATNPQNVPWPWLHENTYMLEGRKSLSLHPESRQKSRATSNASGQNISPIGQVIPTSDARDELSETGPLEGVIENLVAYAASMALLPQDRESKTRYWESASNQLSETWGYGNTPNSHQALYELFHNYMRDFNVLWPLLEQRDPGSYHPVLFLTVTSVGAMFGTNIQRQYGNLMHQRLRRLLSASLFDLEGPGDGMIWLAEARLITQIAALYFGHHQGFSYAQHLAAITIAQLRRMDYFREPVPDRALRTMTFGPGEELARYQHFECRRRIAFGILRADIYTSILLNTRPLLTTEEMKLTLLRPTSLWLNSANLSGDQLLGAWRLEESRALSMPLSDLVRIFMERNEPNPYLSPVGHEIVLFGLQEAVWRFSQDPELFPRLTGRCLADTDITYSSRILTNPEHAPSHMVPTGFWQRRMDDLHSDRVRLIRALDTWSSAVDLAISRGAYANHGDILLSSMLLYRLSKLRLCAPMEELHHISYNAANPERIDSHIHRKVEAWLDTKFAVEAAHLAWDIKTLIETNIRRAPEERARFNFLGFCSLHHAAVTLWTVIAVHDGDPTASTFDIPNHSVQVFLDSVAGQFHKISPLGSNSFEAAAQRLQEYRFPRLDAATRSHRQGSPWPGAIASELVQMPV